MKNALITGGAGFIGSNLLKELQKYTDKLYVIDNFVSGYPENIQEYLMRDSVDFIKMDFGDLSKFLISENNIDTVFHLAAYPEVRTGFEKPFVAIEENMIKTYKLLETIRQSNNIQRVIFTSSSTVYGNATELPTNESYGPLLPISSYGASKLACESLISGYSHTYGLEAKIYRLANIVGRKSRRGIIWDFLNKLKKNPAELEILGNGYQSKSYLHIDDCVNGIIKGLQSSQRIEVFNLGNTDTIDTFSIARMVCNSLDLKETKFHTKNKNYGGGWIGDVQKMHLDIRRLESLGWKPTLTSENAIKAAICETLVNDATIIKP